MTRRYKTHSNIIPDFRFQPLQSVHTEEGRGAALPLYITAGLTRIAERRPATLVGPVHRTVDFTRVLVPAGARLITKPELPHPIRLH